MFLVSQCGICSKSLVGQRWCLTSCSAVFVWLQFYMRSYACWIATLWHDTYAVWDSSAFRECCISFFLDRCRLLFVWLVCPLTGPRVLGITVVLYSEIATLWHDTHSVWFSFHFWAVLIISWNFAGFLLSDKLCFFLSRCFLFYTGTLVRDPWLVSVDVWDDVW